MGVLSLNDLWYRWLEGQLPADVSSGDSPSSPGSGTPQYFEQSVSAYGSLQGTETATANAVIATIPSASLPAGKYKVTVTHFVSAATSPSLVDNVNLRAGSTVLARVLHLAAVNNSTAYTFVPKLEVYVELDGSTALSINFIANFGAGESQTHNAQIIATKVA